MEVFLIVALSADGFLGRDSQHSSVEWRSKEDGRFFMEKTREAGAVVMGSTTFFTMRKPMPGRKHYILTSSPEKFSDYDQNQVTALSANPQEVVARAKTDGFEKLAICGGSNVYAQFVENNLVDKFYLTIEPVFFGDGVRLFDRELGKSLELIEVHHLSSQTVVLEYQNHH